MSSTAPDGGLTFSAEQLRRARDKRDDPTIRSAINLLDAPVPDALDEACLTALRVQFSESDESARIAWRMLADSTLRAGPSPATSDRKRLLGWLSVAAMLRENQSWQSWRRDYAGWFAAAITSLEAPKNPLDRLWQGALKLAAGIVFENEPDKSAGADIYRDAIDRIVHPEGYLKGITDVVDSPASYAAQVSGACALVMMAEMAAQAGLDLWAYDNRGVTPATASTYLLYYFYFPEKWKWSPGLTRELSTAVMRREGAFIEVVNHRSPLRDVEPLLQELRPLFCPWAGGLTTLTHGLAPQPTKRRWRLW